MPNLKVNDSHVHGVVNKRDIVREVYKKVSVMSQSVKKMGRKKRPVTEEQVMAAVDAFFEEISLALACGDRVELRGFGSMVVRKRDPKVARNPRTNELVKVPEKGWLHFRFSRELLKVLKNHE